MLEFGRLDIVEVMHRLMEVYHCGSSIMPQGHYVTPSLHRPLDITIIHCFPLSFLSLSEGGCIINVPYMAENSTENCSLHFDEL